MILYPTETVYGLGVNALDPIEVGKLYELKARNEEKMISWLVRDIEDIRRYTELSDTADAIARAFLPGKITLVLPINREVVSEDIFRGSFIGMRISSDTSAQKMIEEFMGLYNSPLTCTSANVSGMPTLSAPAEILKQFGSRATMIDTVIDDGSRAGVPTTVVKVVGEGVEMIREGEITREMISKAIKDYL